jgi:hypothetical protein
MATKDLTQVRIAENQSRFREANETIQASANNIGLADPIPFICECADRACTEIVRLTFDGYEDVRQYPRRFFNATGHEAISVEAGAGVVVDRYDEYVVVEKIDLAGEIAAETYDELAP